MRISDWSSDVCSSDLFPPLIRRRVERCRLPAMRVLACLLALFVLAACAGDREPHISSPVAARFADEAASAPQIEVTATDRQPVETAELIAQIGRASCRERVCQYV